MKKFHIFLTRKVKSSQNNSIFALSWNKKSNLIAVGCANGQLKLYTVVPSRDQPGSVQIEMPTVLEQHKKQITSVAWANDGNHLVSGDSTGKVVFWKKKERNWRPYLNNDSIQSGVLCIKYNKSSKNIAISYGDNTVACVNTDGDPVWSQTLQQPAEFLEFTSNSQFLIVGTKYGEVILIDEHGTEVGNVPLPCLLQATSSSAVVALEWHRRAEFGLLIAFQGGQVQLMRNEHDTQPISLTYGIEITTAAWLKNGSSIVLGGIRPTNRKSVILLVSPIGDILRELDINANTPIFHISSDQADTLLAISIGEMLMIAQIIPAFHWAFTENTLLFSYNLEKVNEFITVYFNQKTEYKRIQNVQNLIDVAGHNGHFAICSTLNATESKISVTNTIGVNVDSININMTPIAIGIYDKSVVFCSSKTLSLWKIGTKDPPVSIELSIPPNEAITALHISEKSVIISVGNRIILYDNPSLAETQKIEVGYPCEAISSSSDFSSLALVDNYSTLQFYSCSNFQPLGQVFNDIWNLSFASDIPSLFAAMEKQKLTVFTDNVPEEPIQSLSYIAKFVDYEIMTVDLIRLMRDPLDPSRKIFRTHPTKILKDLRTMLSLRPQTSVDEIISYAREHPKKKIWDEIAESMMQEMNFAVAERCYLETTNYQGLQFIKRIRNLKDPHIQRAQILSYLGRFDESEALFLSMDRLDLAIEMRANIGDFKHVIALLRQSDIADDVLKEHSFTAVGDEHCEEGDWFSAADSYEIAGNDEECMKCLFLNGNYDALLMMLHRLPDTSPLLPVLGNYFVALGAIENAVDAFKRSNNIESLVDACARLNHWKPALQYAGKGRSDEIRARMARYARSLIDTKQTAAAIDFYVRAGLHIEAARLLLKYGDDLIKEDCDYVAVKMCYVFAGIQIEKSKNVGDDDSPNARENLLEGLIREDKQTAASLSLEIWRKAEAIHFLVSVHQKIHQRDFKNAVYIAGRLFDDYSDIIGEARAAAILALCGMKSRFYGQCSRALTTLEHSDQLSEENQKNFEELAIDVFVRTPPFDPPIPSEITCPQCDAEVPRTASQCYECGIPIPVCLITGHAITSDPDHSWCCSVCKHYVRIDFADTLTVCPLCHHPINDDDYDNHH